ncbi:hypothetical protein [Arthrobacter sp. B0490]|uniref:hypothetical protein n=1 Tax=Arthrobacter sp. B0490 TaxID=2058891 RepID=UPI000CE57B26|nr:hypothetical protein [Arthrobacter sp. B0490]
MIFDRADEHLDLRTRAGRVDVVALPALSGAVMTMFDGGLDPISATIRRPLVILVILVIQSGSATCCVRGDVSKPGILNPESAAHIDT